MGFKELNLKVFTNYTEEQLKKKIARVFKLKNLNKIIIISENIDDTLLKVQKRKRSNSNVQDCKDKYYCQIKRKSLDARNKEDIHWNIKVAVFSHKIKGARSRNPDPQLKIPYENRKKKALVIGSGPAGFFTALILLKAGFKTTIIERGASVDKRAKGISKFDKTGIFDPICNYAFGEGGAGTFSDGKLTSRSKNISLEKEFIYTNFINAGADREIKFMSHPHLGTDNLIKIVRSLRHNFLKLGGQIYFETYLRSLDINRDKVIAAVTDKEVFAADYFIFATGHSAYDTYRMLIEKGVKFRVKNFAIGCRVEHPQKLINLAQWGTENIPGLSSAEYRLTSKGANRLPVYTFCMCPGGSIINASAFNDTNIVNGMSLYKRNGYFANAACVAGVDLSRLTGRDLTPSNALNWVESLEKKFYSYGDSFKAPYCSIHDFINRKEPSGNPATSYSLGLTPSRLWEMLPEQVSNSISQGLIEFSKKISGFDTGNIIGLETKTSSPIQALRNSCGCSPGFENLFIVGEGSGYSGGIISSAVDGIKTAMTIVNSNL